MRQQIRQRHGHKSKISDTLGNSRRPFTFCTKLPSSCFFSQLRSRRRAADAGIREMKVSMLHPPNPTQERMHELYCTCAYRLAALIENERPKGGWFGRSTLHEPQSWCGCEVISSALVSLSICLRRGGRSGLESGRMKLHWHTAGANSKPVKTRQNQGEQRGAARLELSNLESATVSGGTSSILVVYWVLLGVIGRLAGFPSDRRH